MSRRIIYLIILIALIGLGSAYFLLFRAADNANNHQLLHAIPSESPLIVNVNHPVVFFKEIESNEMIQSLRTIEAFNLEYQALSDFFDFLKADDGSLLEKLKGKQTLLSLNFSGKNDISLLLLVKTGSNSDTEITQRISNLLSDKPNVSFSSRKYNKSTITQIQTNSASFFIAEKDGLALFSRKSILVEEALRQIETDFSVEHPEIKPLLKTVDMQANAQLFINHDQIDQLVSGNLSPELKTRSILLPLFAEWTELDLNLKDKKILLSGFSNGQAENNLYGTIFLNQQPYNSRIDKVIPQNASYFLNLCLSDVNQFFNDYEDFLTKQNLALRRQDQLNKIEKLTGTNILAWFQSVLSHDVASAGIVTDQAAPNSGRIFIVETKSGNTAMQQVIELQNAYLKAQRLNAAEWSNEYKIDEQTSFTIYRFPFDNLPQLIFGKIFNGIKTNWVTVYDNYLIFGDSFHAVGKAVRANILGETLAGSLDFSRIKSDLNSRSNINFYCNTAASLPIASAFFNHRLSNEIAGNEELLKFKSFTWQISSTGEMLYNNACLSYNSEVKAKPQTIWQSHIKANFDFKPIFVTNHYDPENKEVVIQDNEFNFYLINNVGRILWQIKLDGPILGDVQQIDYFKNGKLQYLFNTANKLYIIDREGNFVKNYPVNFRAPASNSVSVFDYDNNKDYRFFVACTDKRIYAYQTDGNLVKGWNLFKTDHEVYQPIQHFRVEGKDYIVASDAMKDYILHRTGEVRVKTDQIYPHSVNNTLYLEERTAAHAPRIVSTENNGTIHYTYFDGKHETVKNIELGSQHYFVADNIDNDEETEYIFVDGNTLYVMKNNGKMLLTKKMDAEITHPPHIYTFAQHNKKIGITCKLENKIYLFDINGNLHPGFPLDGCTEFSIGFISKDNTNFNLLVGSPDGYLYNYYVE